jgi:hypothetical protein
MRESMVVNSEFDATRAHGRPSSHGEPLPAQCSSKLPAPLHPVAPSFTQLHQNIFAFGRRSPLLLALAVLLCALAFSARAALQFDVFLGYDGVVPNGTWIPVVCEVKNDGPSFTGMVEVDADAGSSGQKRRMVVELPTGTLKRFTIPVISTTRNYQRWDVRLLDERGKVRAEQLSIQFRKEVNAGTPILGALPRTASFTPSLLPIKVQQPAMQPTAARLLPTIFPDNPLVLEGMSALYLNSAKAADLRLREPNQVDALYRWLNAGGHLIIGVEQITDITSTPWLDQLFPVELKDIKTIRRHPELQDWLRNGRWTTNATRRPQFPGVNLPGQRRKNPQFPPSPQSQVVVSSGENPFTNLESDSNFELAEMQVAVGNLRDGQVVQDAEDTPLIITANRGRGRITVLMFSPEREPFRSWKNIPTFWSKLADVPGNLFVSSDYGYRGEVGSDGIFGAMIDTRQVHKLPVEWLLLLLIVYLVVIGPLDQFWLKKIGKPMLTWITFPCYVVMFSLLIYFIGYKLRAGESEWNELHLVDVFPTGDNAQLRGRTYASIYAPSNQRYEVEGDEKYATLRGEYVPTYGANQSSEKANVMQNGDTFKAEIFVPVWTSQLFITDWWQPAAVPLAVTVTSKEDGWEVKAENRTDHKLTNAKIAVEGYLVELGDIPSKETKVFKVARAQGTLLKDFVTQHGQNFSMAAHSRQRSFGGSESGQIGDMPNSTVAASFLSQLDSAETFIAPPGLDMSSTVAHGNAVLFAWEADYTPVKPLYHVTPRRAHQNTLWRVTVPLQ